MSPRMSADDRKEQVIRAAVTEFSIRGFEGTSTSDIAKRVGVSQPYLFRLFPTKKDLFLAALERGVARIGHAFAEAAEGKYGQEALFAMGGAYQELLGSDRELLMMQLQQYSACHDPDIQAHVRGCMQRLWAKIETLSGAPLEARVDFLAKGMLCNAIAAMGRDDGMDPQWVPVLEVMRASTARGTAAGADADAPKTGRTVAAASGALDSRDSEVEDAHRRAYAEYIEGGLFGPGPYPSDTLPGAPAAGEVDVDSNALHSKT